MLVERDAQLASLWEAVPGAPAAWAGRWVFLGGEAGVGKTSLVGALLDRLRAADRAVVRRGFCDNVATPAPLGPGARRDARARRRDRADDPGHPARGCSATIRALLTAGTDAAGARGPALGGRGDPGAVRFLGRRLDGAAPARWSPPSATTRSARATRSRRCSATWPTAPASPACTVAALTVDAVRRAGRDAGSAARPGRAAPPHRRQPVLRHRGARRPATARRPTTVRDAVLARASRLPDGARDVLAAAAVLGPGADAPRCSPRWPGATPAASTSACGAGCWSRSPGGAARVPPRARPRDGREQPRAGRRGRGCTHAPARPARPGPRRRRTGSPTTRPAAASGADAVAHARGPRPRGRPGSARTGRRPTRTGWPCASPTRSTRRARRAARPRCPTSAT